MKGTTVNANTFIQFANQAFAMMPVLLHLIYYVALIVLAYNVWKARSQGGQGMSVTEWAAVAIALGLAMK